MVLIFLISGFAASAAIARQLVNEVIELRRLAQAGETIVPAGMVLYVPPGAEATVSAGTDESATLTQVCMRIHICFAQ